MATVRFIGVGEKKEKAGKPFTLPKGVVSYIEATPLALILGFFLLLPILMIVVVSFWDYDFASDVSPTLSPLTIPKRSAPG